MRLSCYGCTEKIPKPRITLRYSLQQLFSFPSALQALRMSGARYVVVGHWWLPRSWFWTWVDKCRPVYPSSHPDSPPLTSTNRSAFRGHHCTVPLGSWKQIQDCLDCYFILFCFSFWAWSWCDASYGNLNTEHLSNNRDKIVTNDLHLSNGGLFPCLQSLI